MQPGFVNISKARYNAMAIPHFPPKAWKRAGNRQRVGDLTGQRELAAMETGTMQKKRDTLPLFVMIGGLNGLVAVALGAFGAHSLKAVLEANQTTAVYQTAAQYQMAHALALLLVALLSERFADAARFRAIGWLFAWGILIFSGSLYLLALTNVKILGAITPLGGLCFLSGWTLLILTAAKNRVSGVGVRVSENAAGAETLRPPG